MATARHQLIPLQHRTHRPLTSACSSSEGSSLTCLSDRDRLLLGFLADDASSSSNPNSFLTLIAAATARCLGVVGFETSP